MTITNNEDVPVGTALATTRSELDDLELGSTGLLLSGRELREYRKFETELY